MTADIENKIDKGRNVFMTQNTKYLFKLDIDDLLIKSIGKNKCNAVDKLCNKFEMFDKSYKK